MSKVYIKKIISSLNELKFIKLDLSESEGIIDKIILVDANYTHSGLKREYFSDKTFKNTFSENELERIIHLKINISSIVRKDTANPIDLHFNERIIRGAFQYEINLKDDDIIFSLDADEVLYRITYYSIIEKIRKNDKGYLLKLHNLIYRPDYLWSNFIFIAPTACKVKFYNDFLMKLKSKFKKFKQWRYHGHLHDEVSGVHFNWHLTPKEMLEKINNYAHKDLFYKENLSEKYFKNLIEKKEFIDSSKKIEVKVLELNNEQYLPKSFYKNKKLFEYLLK